MYDRILQILQKSDIISDPRIIELNVYGERQFRVKIISGSPLEDVLIVLQEIGRFLGESRDDLRRLRG